MATRKPEPSQTWSAKGYEENARFVSDLGAGVVTLLDPKPGERILDLGCGDGFLTLRIAESGATVRGFDASPELAAAARQRGLTVDLGDAHELPYANEFDAVFSNAALHWMSRPGEVVAGVHRALKPGGRFVAEMGGHGNVAAIRTALAAAFASRGIDYGTIRTHFYPTAEEYSALLRAHGFEVLSAELFPRPTPLPTGMEGWLSTFAKGALDQLPDGDREKAKAEVIALLRPNLCDGSGRWTADYVRLRFAARRAD
jgi:SAM-dependent methyltransferase